VVESLQTAEHLLTAATHEFNNLMRTQKAVTIYHAKDLRIARGHLNGSKIVCAPKARMAGERHPFILPYTLRGGGA
jgi:hypothetical protein